MAASSRARSSGPVLPISCSLHHHRSVSPSGRFSSSSSSGATSLSSSSSSFASSSSSSFSTRSSSFFSRSASPTRVKIVGSPSHLGSSSVRFSIADRPTSPSRSLSVAKKHRGVAPRKTCMCSPTAHPGSFRCSLHKGLQGHHAHPHAVSSPSNRLNARRSAMTNSLVRIATVEGDLVKRALAALIRPSSHSQRRREGFQSRPSRLSVMSKASSSDLS